MCFSTPTVFRSSNPICFSNPIVFRSSNLMCFSIPIVFRSSNPMCFSIRSFSVVQKIGSRGSVGLILTLSALPNGMTCMATQWHSTLCHDVLRRALLRHSMPWYAMRCSPFLVFRPSKIDSRGSFGLMLTFSALPNGMICLATQWHSTLCHDALRRALLRHSMPWYAMRRSPFRNQCILRHQPMRIDGGSTHL